MIKLHKLFNLISVAILESIIYVLSLYIGGFTHIRENIKNMVEGLRNEYK